MSKTINLDILKKAEAAGIHLVVDGFSDLGAKTPILNPPDQPVGRCNVVREARKIANSIATRKALHDGELVYGNSTAALETVLKAMLAYIERHMKGKSDAKQAHGVAGHAQQDGSDVVDHADHRPEGGDQAGDGKPKAARKTA